MSADRDQGLNRAGERMSEEGRENTSARNSPNRATRKDRAEQRHMRHQKKDDSDKK